MKRRAFVSVMLLFALAAIGLAKDSKAPTDDYITDQVRLKLAGDQVVKGGALQVVVKQGVTTLSGVVETQEQQQRAAKLAKKVKGVKQVVNQITLRDKNAKQ